MLALALCLCAAPPPDADPLPLGAVARLGSSRYRFAGSYHRPRFFADGRRVLLGGHNVLAVMNVADGRITRSYSFTASIYSLTSFDLSPDGRTIAVATLGSATSQTGVELRFIDVASGMTTRTLKLAEKGPGRVVFSRDGRFLAYAAGGEVAVEDVKAERPVYVRRFEGASHHLAFSPDGTTLAVMCMGHRGYLVSWKDRRGPVQLPKESTSRTYPMFSPDGRRLVTSLNADEGGLQVFDAVTGKLLREVEPPAAGHGRSVVWSPDGKTLAAEQSVGEGRLLAFIDAETFAVRRTVPLREYGWYAFSPDGKTLAVLGGTGLDLIDVATGRLTPWPGGRARAVVPVGLTNEGRVVTVGDDGVARVYDVRTGRESLSVDAGAYHYHPAAVPPDGSRLAYSAKGDYAPRLAELTEGKTPRLFPETEAGDNPAVRFSPDGRRVLHFNGADRLTMRDAVTGLLIRDTALDLSDAGKPVPAPMTPGRGEWVWRNFGAAFSPDGSRLVVNRGWTLKVFDADSGATMTSFPPYLCPRGQLAFTPDNAFLLVGCDGGQYLEKVDPVRPQKEGHLALYDLATKSRVRGYRYAHEGGGPVAFGPGGKWFAAASSARFGAAHVVAFVETETGKERGRLSVPGRVTGMVLSPDGRRIVVGQSEGTALVYPVP